MKLVSTIVSGCFLAGCSAHLATPTRLTFFSQRENGRLPSRDIGIMTAQVDSARTGSNSAEIYLTTANVRPATFGKLFTRSVDATFYAQPLYLSKISRSRTVNVVYIATMHNTVYAFDADNPAAAAPLWSVNLGTPDAPQGWLNGLGILSTPVIVRSLQAMYVVTATREDGHRVYRLHALDLLTGKEKFRKSTVIEGQVPGKAADGHDGTVAFNPDQEVQRASLAVSGDNVYVAFAADRDIGAYHGWVFGFHLKTLRRTAIFNVTPYGAAAGIWQSGHAPAVGEDGSLYFETGNGDFNGKTNFGETVLKLLPDASGAVKLADWFTPYNWAMLNDHDYDLSSSGPTLIPGTSLMIVAGKTGEVYVIDTKNLGHVQANDSQIVQRFQATPGCQPTQKYQNCEQIMGQVFWATAPVPTLYVWGVHDELRAFQFVNGRFNPDPVTNGIQAYYPGGVLAHSSYLGTKRTGIVWAITSDKPDNQYYFGPGFTGPGTLHAFDAEDLTRELWNSNQNAARDTLGVFPSFTPPLIANGKVYAPSFSNELVVYGLLNGPIPGDANGDSTVNCADLSIIRASLGKSADQPGFDLRADVTGDGVINVRDLAFVSRHLPPGASCP